MCEKFTEFLRGFEIPGYSDAFLCKDYNRVVLWFWDFKTFFYFRVVLACDSENRRVFYHIFLTLVTAMISFIFLS